MKETPTYNAVIYVSLMEKYTRTEHDYEELQKVCQDFVDAVGLCVSVSPVEFIYTGGIEFGFSVTLINYPRFPSTPDKIKTTAISLAGKLKKALGQYRVSIVCSDVTIMLEEDEDEV